MNHSVTLEVDRWKVVPYFLVAAGLFVLSIWAFVHTPTTTLIQSETFVRLIMSIAAVGTLYAAIRTGWFLLVKRGLELESDALTVRIAGPPVRVATWDDLEGVSYSSQYTFLHLNSGKRLRLNPWVKGLSGSLPSQALAETITNYGASIGWREIDAP